MDLHSPSNLNQARSWRSGTRPLVFGHISLTPEYFSDVLTKFLQLQEDRLLKTRLKLNRRGQWFLDALPLFLHQNHPALPGYDRSAPSGIVNYTADSKAMNAVRHLSHTLGSTDDVKRSEIQAVYMMGSAGSVAQTRRSDLDLWVCLPRAAHQRLRPKLDALERFASNVDVELQAFAVDPAQFSQGSSAASSPLLLDEFYRSACWLAGSYPLWWLVPPHLQGHHHELFTKELREGNYLAPHTWLDFGSCDTFSNRDLSIAVIRALQGVMTDPHKSLLKLVLLESYARGARPLSQTYKEHVHDGGEVDAYLLLADHLDREFAQDTRLHTLRNAWISKTSRKNARLANNQTWLQRASSWGFDQAQIDHQRFQEQWLIADFIDENNALHDALKPTLFLVDQLCAQSADPLPVQQTLQFERLRTRLESRPMLVNPATPKRGEASVHSIDAGFELVERERSLVQTQSQTGIIHWMIRSDITLHALREADRNDAYLTQLYDALHSQESLWLVSINHNPDATTIARFDDFLSHGREQRNLLSHCEFISSDVVEFKPIVDMITTLLSQDEAPDPELKSVWPLTVIGNLLRSAAHKYLLTLLDEASTALQQPATHFLMAQASEWVLLSKDGTTVQAVNETDIDQLLTHIPNQAKLALSSQTYFPPKLLQQLTHFTP